MDKQPVGQLPDLTQSNNDDEIMVITNSEYNQLKKEKISDLITDFTSTDENNAIVKGTDGKLFTKDFGNASNITEGTLPVSVLPDIPKDKLPEIETDDLPDSGITAGTYTYPTDIVVNSKGQVTSITEGQAGANNANQDLSNLSLLGLDKINQSKALETGSVSSDADVYADVQKYAHSTFDLSKFTVVGSPTISDDGVASGFSTSNYITSKENIVIPSTAKSIEISGSFILGERNGKTQQFYNLSNGLRAEVREDYGALAFFPPSGYSSVISYYLTLNEGDVVKYLYKIDLTTNISESICYINGGETISKTMPSSGTFSGIDTKLMMFNLNYVFQGSIDLKQFSITVDGVPVFSGNKTGVDTYTINNEQVKIPYTLSKTGSKIVDAAYRDRVQSLYEQTGEALFYTLDEQNQNFTLPASDIYGMISNTRDFSLNKTQLTNCILSAPNGVATFSGSNITLKQGLKVLYPNGRNADGTLKNGELTLDSDTILDLSSYSGQTFDFELMFGCNINYSYISQNYQESDVVPTNISGYNQIYLNTTENQMYFYFSSSSSWAKKTLIKLGKGKLENGVVTSLTPYQPVELIKRTDPQIQAPYITETYVNGTSWYRVWSDGWIEQGGRSKLTDYWTITFPKAFTTTNYTFVSASEGADVSDVLGVTGRTTTKINGNNANQGTLYYNWRACGY